MSSNLPELLKLVKTPSDLDTLIASGSLPVVDDKWFQRVFEDLDTYPAKEMGKVFSIVSHIKVNAETEHYRDVVEKTRIKLLNELSRLFGMYSQITVKEIKEIKGDK